MGVLSFVTSRPFFISPKTFKNYGLKVTLRVNGSLKQVDVTPGNHGNSQQHSETFGSDDPPEVWRPLLGLDLIDSPAMRNTYRSFAYACINKKALNISKPSIYLYLQQRVKQKEIKDHPFLNLTHSRNSLGQSFRTILYVASANCDLNGWAFIKINSVQTGLTSLGKKGRTPVEFIPLPAKYVMPVYDSQNSMILYYQYGSKKYLPEEIITFKVPNPDSNVLPNPPVKAFNFTLDIDYLQSRSRRKFFNNDARPTLHIGFPTKLDPKIREMYVDEYSRKQSGTSNNGRSIITDNGAEVSALNTNPRELDYVNSRRQILDEIMLGLDVNAQVMGMFEDSNYNNSKNAVRGWMEQSIVPYAELVFQEPLTAFVYDYYDSRLLVTLDYFLDYDRETQLKALEFYSKEKIVKKIKIAEMEGFSENDVPESSKKQDLETSAVAEKTEEKPQDNET